MEQSFPIPPPQPRRVRSGDRKALREDPRPPRRVHSGMRDVVNGTEPRRVRPGTRRSLPPTYAAWRP